MSRYTRAFGRRSASPARALAASPSRTAKPPLPPSRLELRRAFASVKANRSQRYQAYVAANPSRSETRGSKPNSRRADSFEQIQNRGALSAAFSLVKSPAFPLSRSDDVADHRADLDQSSSAPRRQRVNSCPAALRGAARKSSDPLRRFVVRQEVRARVGAAGAVHARSLPRGHRREGSKSTARDFRDARRFRAAPDETARENRDPRAVDRCRTNDDVSEVTRLAHDNLRIALASPVRLDWSRRQRLGHRLVSVWRRTRRRLRRDEDEPGDAGTRRRASQHVGSTRRSRRAVRVPSARASRQPHGSRHPRR